MFDPQTLEIIRRTGQSLGCDPDAFAAVTWVESAGTAYWKINGHNLPAIRFEGHYFYKRLTGDHLHQAVTLGLAHPNAGAVKNSNSWKGRYAMLARAREINNDMALESISMGVGQVMGAWWNELGYDSVEAMWNRCLEGIEGQCEIMARYIGENGLTKYLNRRDWDKFAERYNGPGYRRYNYHVHMASAYRMLTRQSGGKYSEANEVVWLQSTLEKLGYAPGPVDGIKGTKTKDAIKKFQADKGLVVDGIAGTMTIDALREALDYQDRKNGV